MKKGKTPIFLLVPFLFVFFSLPVKAEVPDEVKALTGEYKGSWCMFGLGEAGKIIQKMKWTDTMIAENPVVKDGKAYVTTRDNMTFEGGIPSQVMEGKEGYVLNPDGSLGDYFFEANGQVQLMKELEENVWVYTLPASSMEMAMLGFSNVTFSNHVVVKVVRIEEGMETHRISRVTTVAWKDPEGKEYCRQFISLQGMHRRQK